MTFSHSPLLQLSEPGQADEFVTFWDYTDETKLFAFLQKHVDTRSFAFLMLGQHVVLSATKEEGTRVWAIHYHKASVKDERRQLAEYIDSLPEYVKST